MSITRKLAASWIFYRPDNSSLSDDQILTLIQLPPVEILRDHHRSRVNKKQLDDQFYVEKLPHNKNRSLWIRLTTLYRDSEVVFDLKSQILLNQMGVNSVTPIAALEKRKFGMVHDSRIIYRFENGQPVNESNYAAMLEIMNKLHANGYLHDDPHVKNFLVSSDTGKTVFAIDCKPRRNYLSQLGFAHNYINLAQRSDNPQLIYRLLNKSPENNSLYKMVWQFTELQRYQRSLKNRLRKALGIEHKKKRKPNA